MIKNEIKGYFQAIGAKIYYERKGTGPAVMFLHAGIADCRMWQKEYDALGENFHVIRLDLPGFGSSDFTGGEFSYSGILQELLEFLRLDCVHIIAASFGGNIAMDFAVSYPDMCRSLVLESPALSGWEDSSDLQKSFEIEERLLEEKNVQKVAEFNYELWILRGRDQEAVDKRIKDLVIDMQWKALTKKEPDIPCEEMEEEDNINRLARIKAPVLLLNGEKDVKDFLEISSHIHREVPSSDIVLIENAGHLANLEAPELVLETIVKFYELLKDVKDIY